MRLDHIPKKEHENVIGVYWMMLRTLEEAAYDTKDILDMRNVEQYYRLWNRMTDDDKRPRWVPDPTKEQPDERANVPDVASPSDANVSGTSAGTDDEFGSPSLTVE